MKFGKTTKTEIVKCRVAMVAPCLQGGPRLVAHRLRWGPRGDPCTEHTMNRCEPCAIKQKRTGAAEGPPARVLSKKTPLSCTSKVLPPIEGVGTFTGNGPPAVVPRNRVITVLGTLLYGQIDNVLVRCFCTGCWELVPRKRQTHVVE